ncbi:ribokinase [Clostridium guangxiense]|uniref:ribokinase n=1 Tax=Clostridium guangxiense TaxID=1662055 RepID=UPI001E4AD89F|nr:ribokinase [Clostridium guangxiense]MCD2346968.1 ribokinase [Clostridium guangxiense]
MNKLCFFGSMNMDMVVAVDSMPRVGETILCNNVKKIPGGKGANQAIAAKRSGAEVYMIAKVGKDENGNALLKGLEADNISTKYVLKDYNESTGMAIITVNKDGNNSIIVVPGSNMNISKSEILEAQEAIRDSDILVTQLETPMDAAAEAFKMAKKYNKMTVLNPSPAKTLSDELIENTDIIVPNETEAYKLTGIEVKDVSSAKEASKFFLDKGVKAVITTLGENGAIIVTKENAELIPAYKVKAIDTTAAGDSFLGAVVSKIDSEKISFENLKEAVKFGSKVSSIAVQKKGAQPSIPYLKEVNEIYKYI